MLIYRNTSIDTFHMIGVAVEHAASDEFLLISFDRASTQKVSFWKNTGISCGTHQLDKHQT